jgi:hypothetical protein
LWGPSLMLPPCQDGAINDLTLTRRPWHKLTLSPSQATGRSLPFAPRLCQYWDRVYGQNWCRVSRHMTTMVGSLLPISKIFADFPFTWNIRYISQKSARKLKPDKNKNVET